MVREDETFSKKKIIKNIHCKLDQTRWQMMMKGVMKVTLIMIGQLVSSAEYVVTA